METCNKPDTIKIDDVEYVRTTKVGVPALRDPEHRKIVRAISAGVFFGDVIHRDGAEVTILNARRLWYWDGAASLSELATRGTSKPDKCKFPASAPKIIVLGVIEILDVSPEAGAIIDSVPVWSV